MADPQKPARRTATTIISDAGRPVAVRIREIALDVVRGPDQGASAVLQGRRLSLGTDPTNELVLTDPAASRFHCRVRADSTGYRLTDVRSTNGTFVDGVRVREAYLADGARIDVGESTIAVTFRTDELEIELSPDERFGDAVGRSVAMSEVFAMARRAARSESTVLLLGETGTGKDVLARAIHEHSARSRGPFVVFDCGAAAQSLIESELFGHVRGAFTGADSDRDGVFERAAGGTVFLDEVGELPLPLQPKLLRALDNRVISRVGSTDDVPVDVRILAATHRDLSAMVEAEQFRSDLYYRLAIVPIEIPPLRERREDIPLIAGYLLEDLFSRGDTDLLSLRPYFDDAFGGLADYPWPGNVRELRNVLERAVALADPDEMAKHGLAQLVELKSTLARTRGARLPLQLAREQFDREYIRDVLSAAGGDVNRAAEIAEVHPKSFTRLMRRYGVTKP